MYNDLHVVVRKVLSTHSCNDLVGRWPVCRRRRRAIIHGGRPLANSARLRDSDGRSRHLAKSPKEAASVTGRTLGRALHCSRYWVYDRAPAGC